MAEAVQEIEDLKKKTVSKPNSDEQKGDSVTGKGEEVDDELNQLLDSALADFHAEDEPLAGASAAGVGVGKAQVIDPASASSNSEDPLSDTFTEEFSDEMAKQFEEAMKSFLSQDPAMMHQIEKLAESASACGDSEAAGQEFEDTLKHTLSSLAQNTEKLQDKLSDEDILKTFSKMATGEGQEDFMPMMQGMMKTLLSKEILYPSLKEISEKYPKWLEDNKPKLTDDDYKRYSDQHVIMKQILADFEQENESDTDDVKKKRFERVMDMMQKMQDLGQPPEDIVGNMAPGLEFDEDGLPKMPNSPEGCLIM
ncbi:hypothetical protein CHS0354_038617 [Potamilus streckersoni]|uniref:Peroxin-19 n=1 Tax=Potamilus streckersoni TaxID=2493646 RepID=A0AAE0WCX3_9BIVA|nr:hypothetical protein CHS0354_038617 [Potamilus streckersoni]